MTPAAEARISIMQHINQQLADDRAAHLLARIKIETRWLLISARLVDSIVKGVPAETVAPRIKSLESERLTIRAAMATAREVDNVIALHPKALDRYRRDVIEIAGAIQRGDPEGNAAIFARIRDLVTAIVVHAQPNTPGVKIDIKGRLAALCSNDAIFPNCFVSGGLVVAREGLEPPTPGL
jgi:hypothetical protein